jgi:hypothetical protein
MQVPYFHQNGAPPQPSSSALTSCRLTPGHLTDQRLLYKVRTERFSYPYHVYENVLPIDLQSFFDEEAMFFSQNEFGLD